MLSLRPMSGVTRVWWDPGVMHPDYVVTVIQKCPDPGVTMLATNSFFLALKNFLTAKKTFVLKEK